MNRKFKRIATIALAATMMFGSTFSVAAAEGDGTAEGTGTYEGGEMKYPTLSVTLPTIPEGTYDYIADPNGLIAATSTAHYENSEFTGETGIFFLTETAEDGTKSYTEKSAAMELENQNAQDIDVTVKLEQKTAGDESIQYASSATFEDTDTANKLYLAITDGAADNPKVSALSSDKAATVTAFVEGVKNNFVAGYDATNGYGYTKKDESDLAAWNKCSFLMTGAINKNATWGDTVTFPTIKVTWSYAEHQDGPALTPASLSSSNLSVVISNLPETATSVTKVELVKPADAGTVAMTRGTHYNYTASTGTFTVLKSALVASEYSGGTFNVTFSDGTVVEIPIA